MVLSDEKIKEYMKRILLSRMRLLMNNGFYGLLLMHTAFSVDENCETAATDGRRIFFGPGFLDEISDRELDFVMMHEILHVALRHCLRQGDRDNERFNIACDIVVNSNILLSNNMDRKSITLQKYGESMHLAPDGKEGCEYTAEQVYDMLPHNKNIRNQAHDGKAGTPGGKAGTPGGKAGTPCGNGENSATVDDHSRWGTADDGDILGDLWAKRFTDACEAISIRDPSNQRGMLPMCAERLFKELKEPQTDWRTILNGFIQEEIVDYSFTPPDRRFDENPFFLPDFNEKDDTVEDILFMIDTSASMSDDMITAAFSEIKGAIDQFGGKLKGWLGFFDAAIVKPEPFASEEEFMIIRPKGGGGTDFCVIFKYLRRFIVEQKTPASIIILTDGYAPFPDEKEAMGIPVLWLINNNDVDPPWGKVARIKV